MTTNVLSAIITAYCACKICCGPKATGITASGKVPTANHTIAASRSIPFGSTVIINYQTKTGNITQSYIVEDRLAKRFDKRFDIFFSSHQEAKRFGIRTNTVTIITP